MASVASCPLCYDKYHLEGSVSEVIAMQPDHENLAEEESDDGEISRASLVMKCGHSFCVCCCLSLLESQFKNRGLFQSLPENPGDSIPCPLCSLTSQSFSRNYQLLIPSHLPADKTEGTPLSFDSPKEKKTCQLCDEADALWYCGQCHSQWQCEPCSELIHNFRRLSDHQKKSIREIPTSFFTQISKATALSRSTESSLLLPPATLIQMLLEKTSPSPQSPSPQSPSPQSPSPQSPSPQSPSPQSPSSSSSPCSMQSELSPPALKILDLINSGKHSIAYLLARREAMSGDGDCTAFVAMCHFDGLGTPFNVIEAKKWAGAAVEKGSNFGRGVFSYVSKKYDQAKLYLLPFAESGYSVAQRCVGMCYESEKKHDLSARYYRLSAEQGNAVGINNVSGYFYGGMGGTVKNQTLALRLLKVSANMGFGMALEGLSRCYTSGIVSKGDPFKGAAVSYMTTGQNFASSQFSLGACFLCGMGVPFSSKYAVYYFRLAANQGNAEASRALGECYYEGEGVSQNYHLAVYHFYQAISLGLCDAKLNLGNCYLEGCGVPKDEEKGIKWISEAAEGGDEFSQHLLGTCYEKGKGVGVDLEMAKKYYQMSSVQGNAEAKERLLVLFGGEEEMEVDQ